jgi:hypothetical protein
LVLHLAGRTAESARALERAVGLGTQMPETSLARAMLGLRSTPSVAVSDLDPPPEVAAMPHNSPWISKMGATL